MTRLARSKRTSVRLAQRARIVLLAAQGMQNKDIAEQLGVGTRAGRALARALRSSRGLQGIERDLPRGAPPVKVDVAKLVELTTQSTPEAATHWSTRKMAAVLGVSASTVMRALAGQRPEAAPRARLQGLARPEVRREARRHRGPVPVPARARAGAVLRREEPGAGAGPHAARAAAEEGARGHHDARLQAQRHDHAVRRAERAGRPGHRPVPAAPPPRRVAEVPAPDRPRDAQGQDAAPDRRQLRHAQAPGRAGSGWPSIRASTCTSRPPRRRG